LTQNVGLDVGRGRTTVAYVHYPEYFYHLERGTNRAFWQLYYLPLHLYLKHSVGQVDHLIANSYFTRDEIRRRWNLDATVIYPPVDVEDFAPLEPREKTVISVGRIVPAKNFLEVAMIASKMRNVVFKIVGVIQDEEYYDTLLRMKPSNLQILPDLPRSALLSELGKASAYLHCVRKEHFGISVVEAMAAGCIPVVHESGGPKEIVNGGYGYTYRTIEDAVEAISRIIYDDELRRRMTKEVTVRARLYGVEVFKGKIKAFFGKLE